MTFFFQRLTGERGDSLKAERGEYSVHAIASGDVTLGKGLELAQYAADGQIRVTGAVQVEFDM